MTLIKIGKIVNTHALKGELRLLSTFPYKEEVFQKGKEIIIDKEDKEIINGYRKHKNFDMITLVNYNDINEVLKYKGKNVYIEKEGLNLPLGKYLDEDLIGLTVIAGNEVRGVVSHIERYPKNVFLSIKKDNNEYLVPYREEFIEKVSLKEQKIYIKYLKGLFE